MEKADFLAKLVKENKLCKVLPSEAIRRLLDFMSRIDRSKIIAYQASFERLLKEVGGIS